MNEWILPSSPNLYRADDAFKELKYVEWHQSRIINNMQIGDIAYVYIWTCQEKCSRKTHKEASRWKNDHVFRSGA